MMTLNSLSLLEITNHMTPGLYFRLGGILAVLSVSAGNRLWYLLCVKNSLVG
jgi:hypothetical protein